MENRSQFSLEAAIADWRKQVSGSAVRCEDLSELEAHLRDSIAARQQTGLSLCWLRPFEQCESDVMLPCGGPIRCNAL